MQQQYKVVANESPCMCCGSESDLRHSTSPELVMTHLAALRVRIQIPAVPLVPPISGPGKRLIAKIPDCQRGQAVGSRGHAG